MTQFEGESVTAAIEKGLLVLGKSRAEVEIHVLAEAKKGLFGFGKQAAKVELHPIVVPELFSDQTDEVGDDSLEAAGPGLETVQQIPTDEVGDVVKEDERPQSAAKEALGEALAAGQEYLQTMIEALGMSVSIEQVRHKQVVEFQVTGAKQGLLIGKHGRNLNALQYLVQTYVHRLVDTRLAIIVNAGDYREKRQAALERLAKQTADKVKRTGETVFLEPMPAFERKQVHAALSKNPYVKTHSEGAEPHRYLVVEAVKNIL